MVICGNVVDLHDTTQKMKFFIKDFFSVNVTKSTVSCRFGDIYWRNPKWEKSFHVHCDQSVLLIYFPVDIRIYPHPTLLNQNFNQALHLTHFQPMLHFYSPWKHQKNSGFSDVFKGYRGVTLVENGLNTKNHYLYIWRSWEKQNTNLKLNNHIDKAISNGENSSQIFKTCDS